MLGPAHRVADRASLVGAGSGSERLGCLQENILRNTAVALHHLWRVALEMTIEHLEYAPRVLQRWIGFVLGSILRLATTIFSVPAAGVAVSRSLTGLLLGRTLIQPTFRIVLLLFRIPAGEETIQVFSIPKIFAQDSGCVRIVHYVIAEFLVVLENVVNQRTQKNNVTSGAQWNPDVCHRRCARIPGIDVDNLRAFFTSFDHPLETNGMILSHG